ESRRHRGVDRVAPALQDLETDRGRPRVVRGDGSAAPARRRLESAWQGCGREGEGQDGGERAESFHGASEGSRPSPRQSDSPIEPASSASTIPSEISTGIWNQSWPTILTPMKISTRPRP